MNGKQSKKLRAMAEMFFQNQHPDNPKKSFELIYKQLKNLHKNKKK